MNMKIKKHTIAEESKKIPWLNIILYVIIITLSAFIILIIL